METYVQLFSKAFALPNLREEVVRSMHEFYSLNRQNIDKNAPILCLVGVKEFRNFSYDLWHRIICALTLQNPDRQIEIIDAPDNLVRKELEKFSFPENAKIIDNPRPK